MKAESANSPLANFDFNWGGVGYPRYDGFASAAAVASPAADGGAGSGTGTGTADGGSGGAAPGTGTQPGASSTPNPNDENLRTLRTNHDRFKSESERWSKLGDYDAAQVAVQHFTRLSTEANTLGKQLGYQDSDIAEAFKANPEKTLAILRHEARQNAGRGDQPLTRREVDQLLERKLGEARKPFDEFQNSQLTEKANASFYTEVDRLIKEDYKDVQVPPEVHEILSDIASELFKNNDEGIAALKKEGKVAAIGETYKEAKDWFLRAVSTYNKWDSTRRGAADNTGQGNANAAASGGKKPTLDDFINATPAASKVLKSFQ